MNYLGDLSVDGRIILKFNVKEVACEDVDWIHLAQDWVKWRTFVNMVIKTIGFYRRREISRLAERLSASQEILHSMQLALLASVDSKLAVTVS
jgi:hypothetical protein